MGDDVDSNYRQTRVECIEGELNAEIRRYEHALKMYNQLDKAASVALGVCSIGSLLLTSGTMGSALTGIGAVTSIPLGSLACLSATGVMVLSLISKRVARKKKKHRDTVRLARLHKSQVVSTVLGNDDTIDEAEFGQIVAYLKNYYDEKEHLRQPSTTFSEDLSAHAP